MPTEPPDREPPRRITPDDIKRMLEAARIAYSPERIKQAVEAAQISFSPERMRQTIEAAQTTYSKEQLEQILENARVAYSPENLQRMMENLQISYSPEQMRRLVDQTRITVSPDQLQRMAENARKALDQLGEIDLSQWVTQLSIEFDTMPTTSPGISLSARSWLSFVPNARLLILLVVILDLIYKMNDLYVVLAGREMPPELAALINVLLALMAVILVVIESDQDG